MVICDGCSSVEKTISNYSVRWNEKRVVDWMVEGAGGGGGGRREGRRGEGAGRWGGRSEMHRNQSFHVSLSQFYISLLSHSPLLASSLYTMPSRNPSLQRFSHFFSFSFFFLFGGLGGGRLEGLGGGGGASAGFPACICRGGP